MSPLSEAASITTVTAFFEKNEVGNLDALLDACANKEKDAVASLFLSLTGFYSVTGFVYHAIANAEVDDGQFSVDPLEDSNSGVSRSLWDRDGMKNTLLGEEVSLGRLHPLDDNDGKSSDGIREDAANKLAGFLAYFKYDHAYKRKVDLKYPTEKSQGYSEGVDATIDKSPTD